MSKGNQSVPTYSICNRLAEQPTAYTWEGGVNQHVKVSRFLGETASKKDHPDVLNLPVFTRSNLE
jgi:hypothetical protein